jgi:hypothetical protein
MKKEKTADFSREEKKESLENLGFSGRSGVARSNVVFFSVTESEWYVDSCALILVLFVVAVLLVAVLVAD